MAQNLIFFKLSEFLFSVFFFEFFDWFRRSGSGYVINNVIHSLKRLNEAEETSQNEGNVEKAILGLASDINYDACFFTKKLADYYKTGVQVYNTDLLNAVERHPIDVLICNPVSSPKSLKPH